MATVDSEPIYVLTYPRAMLWRVAGAMALYAVGWIVWCVSMFTPAVWSVSRGATRTQRRQDSIRLPAKICLKLIGL
jgi:hypothetical protein